MAIAYRDLDIDSKVFKYRSTNPNRPVVVVRLIEALSEDFGGTLHFVYEAEACGFVI